MPDTRRYLFGDSTPFPLETNFLETLTAATDTCVALLKAEAEIEQARQIAADAKKEATKQMGGVDALESALERALSPHLPAGEQIVQRSEAAAQRVAETVAGIVAATREEVTRWRDEVVQSAEKRSDGQNVLAALGPFFVKHALPHTGWEVTWQAPPGVELADARITASTPIGLRLVMGATIPEGHPFARAQKVGAFAEGITLHLERPGGGRLRKGPVAEPLDKWLVTSAHFGGGRAILRLHRTGKEGAQGIEVTVPAEPSGQVPVFRLEGAIRADCPSENLAPDEGREIRRLAEAIRQPIQGLAAHRSTLTSATWENAPVESLTQPGVLARAILDALAPLVREIKQRSSAKGELVLKREVADGRREEIYVSESTVAERWSALPQPQQTVFEAFGIGGESSDPPVLKGRIVAVEPTVAVADEDELPVVELDEPSVYDDEEPADLDDAPTVRVRSSS